MNFLFLFDSELIFEFLVLSVIVLRKFCFCYTEWTLAVLLIPSHEGMKLSIIPTLRLIRGIFIIFVYQNFNFVTSFQFMELTTFQKIFVLPSFNKML